MSRRSVLGLLVLLLTTAAQTDCTIGSERYSEGNG